MIKSNPENYAPLDERPLHQIRQFCLQCVGTSNEVSTCTAYACPLWKLRFGQRVATVREKNPNALQSEKVAEVVAKKRIAISNRARCTTAAPTTT